MSRKWNHNIQYHRAVRLNVPYPCPHALDVGCGTGLLTRELARSCGWVTGIDLDPEVIAAAAGAEPQKDNVRFLAGDVMSYPLPLGGFAYVTSIATLHHLPLEAAFARFRELLASGGVLTIIGLYRPETFQDALWGAAGFVASWAMRRVRHFSEVTAPIQEPAQTLAEIRRAAEDNLPGSVLERRLFFRYSLVWRKPER